MEDTVSKGMSSRSELRFFMEITSLIRFYSSALSCFLVLSLMMAELELFLLYASRNVLTFTNVSYSNGWFLVPLRFLPSSIPLP